MEPRDESKIPTRPNPIVPRDTQPERDPGPVPQPPTARPTRPVTGARVVVDREPRDEAAAPTRAVPTLTKPPSTGAGRPASGDDPAADLGPAGAASEEAPGPDTAASAGATETSGTETSGTETAAAGGAARPLRIGRYTVVGWHVAVAVAVLLAPVVAILGQFLPWGSPWLWLLRLALLGAAGYAGFRAWKAYPSDPPEPKRRPLAEPTPQVVELERPAEPPQEIVEPALYCRVCGRPLETREDQELGVDNDCYVQHGAKRELMPNPAHAQWRDDMRRLQDRETDEQALADARHARELEDWESAKERGAEQWRRDLEQWHVDCARQETFRRSPDGRRLIDRAHTWGAATAGAVGLFVLCLF